MSFLKKEVESRQEVAVVNKNEPPAELADFLQQDAGKGLSTAAEDNLVPLIYILQTGSPQVKKSNSEYIEGAEPGDFLLRNAPNPIVKGRDGLLVQRCHNQRVWVEWRPRDSGGGFIERHVQLPSDARKLQDERNPKKTKFVRPNGNEIVETAQVTMRVFTESGVMPYIFPLTSTGLSFVRGWTTTANGLEGNPPVWSRKYRLFTKERSNQLGTWYGLELNRDVVWVTRDEYIAGKNLYEIVDRGEKQAAAPETSEGTEDAPF